MRRRRIAYLVTGLHGGGAETMLYHLLRESDREQFDPVVISLMDHGKLGGAIAELGVPVYRTGMSQGRPSIGAAWKLKTLVRAVRPDLVQGWMYHGNLAAQLVSGFSRTPVCWCIQNSFESFAAEKPLTRLAIRLSARLSRMPVKIIFVSHASREQHERLGFAPDRSCVIPNGVDPTLFLPSQKSRQLLREELGLEENTLLIGLIARFHPQKDHATFLRAAALLDWKRENVHFVLAGDGVDSNNRSLRELAESPGLQGRVHLLGRREDMQIVTAALDIATSASAYGEALSLAVAEAMACAVPCVVTEVGDSPRLVENAGVVVPPRDAEALAQGWRLLLEAGSDRRRELGGCARSRVEQHYSLKSIVCRYEELYKLLS